MFYRRKIILALLEEFGEELEKIRFQKLLFLISQYQENPSFDFVPYKFGCYSFHATSDLRTLQKYGYVEEGKIKWTLLKNEGIFKQLKDEDKNHIKRLKKYHMNSSVDTLIKLTYTKYPYYAIKSEVANRHLNKEELAIVKKLIPNNTEKTLFTIGYEGISIEKYLNKLINNDVKLLCDVRKNPLSRKTGFSKKSLTSYCNAVGIEYLHIPSFGIDGNQRKNLNTQEDYNQLFDKYEQDVLIPKFDDLDQFMELVDKYDQIALTCFEAESCQCHRGRIADILKTKSTWNYKIKHI